MLITATQLRVGMLLEMDGALYRVMKMQHITPGNWRGMVQTTLRNLQSGSKMEKRFRSTDKVDPFQNKRCSARPDQEPSEHRTTRCL